MSAKRVRRLPILSTDGRLTGMLTNKDVLRHLSRIFASLGIGEGKEFDIPISEFMTREVISISQEDDIRVAASRMMIFGVGGLAVEDIRPPSIGLVTERDLIRTLSSKKGIDFLVASLQFELEVRSTALQKPRGQ